MGGVDDTPEKVKAMADHPPPPPAPGSPLKSPSNAPLMPRGGDANTASTSDIDSDNNLLLSPPLLLEIEDGTPAAEALKANADVRVSKLRKVGRSTRLQAPVRVLKSAARTASGQPGHASDRRGAPAFVAPRGSVLTSSGGLAAGQQPPTIPEVDDEGESELKEGRLKSSFSADSRLKTSIAADSDGGSVIEVSLGDDSASQQSGDENSLNLDDSSTDRNIDLHNSHGPPLTSSVESFVLANKPVHRRHGSSITHAAVPAAVAAACFAGEEMDRKRALVDRKNSDGVGVDADSAQKTSPLISPFTSLFRPTDKLAGGDDDEKNSEKIAPIRRGPRTKSSRLSASLTIPHVNNSPTTRRASLEQLRMPSEISVAETEKHANIKDTEADIIEEDLSDDGEISITEEVVEGETPSHVQIKKHVHINPIVVDIPGSRRQINEETKEEEISPEEDADKEEKAKVKRKISIRPSKKKVALDDEAFHFHAPRSVRKWVRKRRTKEESKNQRSYVKGKVIDGKHELYTMSIAVMFGMRTSIGRTNKNISETVHNERRWLDNDDLMAVEKYEFPPKGSELTPPHQLNHTFKFKDYSPLAFAYLRRVFGVNEYDFLLSVCGNANYIEFQSNAKSGQFFFYSPDGKYMIKTMTNTESKFLRRIMPHYFRHCALNPNTLVTKFLGMYRVKLYHLRRNVKFVVMKSVYDTDKFLHQLFDVKGSSLGRDASPGDAVKKDNDIRRVLPDGAFVLEPGLRERLRKQVENDCHWLRSMKIMDYSMLIGVHNIALRKTKLFKSSSQPSRVFSNDDGDDRSNSSYDASLSNATLDRFLDVDDDDSFLDGYHERSNRKLAHDSLSISDEAFRTVRIVKSPDNVDDESSKGVKKESDALVEKAIEDMYWPFHRFYDIQGLRRMKPIKESLLAHETKKGDEVQQTEQNEGKQEFFKAFFAPQHHPAMNSDGRYNLPTFEKPLSYRKDGGFMMDTSAIDMPLKINVPGAPHVVEYCDGKIIYIGIIDILQQFNIRKRLEARYRRMGTKGWEAASCVHPNLYADRFIRFFDEYTQCSPQVIGEKNGENASEVSDSASNLSEISSKVKMKTT